jgi:alkylresorcinol/alkylpyrone synthase
MNEPSIHLVATHSLLPEFSCSAETIEAAFEKWMSGQSRELQVKARKILRNANVQNRHSFLTVDEIFSPVSLTESMSRYRAAAKRLGVSVLSQGLAKAGVGPREVDILITTSCTGYMIPSVDAYMADELGMRPDLVRLPVTEMGCAAGVSALIYACEMLRGRPGSVAAVVNIELPTNTMQHHDFSMDNIVGTALFSDGAACTVLRNQPDCGDNEGVRVRDWGMFQVGSTTGVLGYQLTDSGFRMNLDASLPDLIGANFRSAAGPILSRCGLGLADVRHFAIHPGGVKILDRIDEILKGYGGSAAVSRGVMGRLGNMSSSTVIFILDEILRSGPRDGPLLLMSFGPGFGAHQMLMQVSTQPESSHACDAR